VASKDVIERLMNGDCSSTSLPSNVEELIELVGTAIGNIFSAKVGGSKGLKGTLTDPMVLSFSMPL